MRNQNYGKLIIFGALALLVSRVGLFAQEPPPPPPHQHFARGAREMPGGADIMFAHKLVKGAPFSAQAVTEINQTLSDGNQIHRTVTATLYRDSAGRTRREGPMGDFGPWAGPQVKAAPMILIHDPVAGLSYVLNPATHTAVRRSVRPMNQKPAAPETPNVAPWEGEGGNVQSESLGTQIISGVQAEGTRTTRTIPAGTVGNQQPINIVVERWYSSALQMVVMSKRTDPMMGQTTYQLTNINQAEPAAALFQVSPDYSIQDAPASPQLNRRPRPAAN